MKWYEIAAAAVLGAFVLYLVSAGLMPRPSRVRMVDATRAALARIESGGTPANVTLVAPPTIHREPGPAMREGGARRAQ